MKHIAMLVLLFVSGCSCHTVEPGERSVLVDWGKVKEPALGEGWQTACLGCDFNDVSIRTQKQEFNADCFSSDLQQVHIKVAVLFRIPEAKVVNIFREYKGEPFTILIAPRTQEAIKEVTATRTAEQIVKHREAVKNEALAAVRTKVGDILVIEDLIVENIELSKELAVAIEQKMVQEQEASKAKFTKQKAEIDAETSLVKAQGEANSTLAKAKAEAEAIKIRGDALRQNPGVIELELVSKWNGVSPTIVSNGGSGLSIIMPAVAK